jgi:hypothetical protein
MERGFGPALASKENCVMKKKRTVPRLVAANRFEAAAWKMLEKNKILLPLNYLTLVVPIARLMRKEYRRGVRVGMRNA